MNFGLTEETYQKSLKNYKKALIKLEEALKEQESEIVIDGVLHRFEFTFELAWKTMKDVLEYQGVITKLGSPREIIQIAFKQNLIDDGEVWIEIMLSRNSLAHIYDEITSRRIYNDIREKYIKQFNDLREKLENI